MDTILLILGILVVFELAIIIALLAGISRSIQIFIMSKIKDVFGGKQNAPRT